MATPCKARQKIEAHGFEERDEVKQRLVLFLLPILRRCATSLLLQLEQFVKETQHEILALHSTPVGARRSTQLGSTKD